MKKAIIKLTKDQRGLSTMEYAVLFVIIVVGAIGLWSSLGKDLATNISQGEGTFKSTLSNHVNGTSTE